MGPAGAHRLEAAAWWEGRVQPLLLYLVLDRFTCMDHKRGRQLSSPCGITSNSHFWSLKAGRNAATPLGTVRIDWAKHSRKPIPLHPRVPGNSFVDIDHLHQMEYRFNGESDSEGDPTETLLSQQKSASCRRIIRTAPTGGGKGRHTFATPSPMQ
jgi:hypothetical protein